VKEADAGVSVQEWFWKQEFLDASYFKWKAKFGDIDVSDAKRLKVLEDESGRLKKQLADALLETKY